MAPLLVYRALSGGPLLLAGLVIAARWGLRELAAYTVASSLIAIGAVISDWGSSRSLPRDLAVSYDERARAIVASADAIRLSLVAMLALLLVLANRIRMASQDSVRYAVLLSPLLILNPLAINGVSVRIVHSELSPFAWAVAVNVAVLAAVAVATAPVPGGASLALGVVAGKAAECAVLIGRRGWLLRTQSRGLFAVALRVLPFSTQYILGTIYSRIPIFVVDRFASREAMGILGAATTVQGVLLLLPTSIALFRFPALTVAVQDHDAVRIRVVVRQYLLVSIAALLASAAVLSLLMPILAPRLHIPSSSEAFVIVYALCALPTVGVLIATVMLQAKRSEAVAARISAIALVASALLQIAAVWRFGLWGAAIALLASEVLSVMLYGLAAKRAGYAATDATWSYGPRDYVLRLQRHQFMFTLILQFLASTVLLVILLKLVSSLHSASPRLQWIVAFGFAGRAIAAQLLFWISYLELPVARSLQLGDGLWFFASDAQLYGALAQRALQGGWRDVIFINQTIASPFYVQVLAVFTFLTGQPVMAGILINLFAYTVSSLIVARIARYAQLEIPAIVAMAALAFSPSSFLWALQPLKDTLFVMLMLLAALLSLEWQRAWRTGESRRARSAAFAISGLCLVTFAIAGIRWYVAVFILATSALLFLIVAAMQRGRYIVIVLAGGFLSLVLMTLAILAAASPYLPPPVLQVLTLGTKGRPVIARVEPASQIETYVEATRKGFDDSGGSTIVRPGPAMTQESEPQPPSPESAETITARTETTATSTGETPPLSIEKTRIQRLAAGAVAMLIPQSLAERLGLVDIGGGRGLILFTDFDTLVFDALLLFVVISATRAVGQGGWRNAVLWQQVVLILLISGALAYTVSNFGTLFRHRAMVYGGLLVVPLLAATRREPERGDALPDDRATA